jgi:anti-sigma regulatory factor (Ser/Thr protein kinase)
MNAATYTIQGGDYTGAGSASKSLKEMLKKIGADPKAVRRTMVAAYEAEMNVVIHAHQGVMRVAVDATQVDVVVMDQGPGIPDIEQAMKEGFSTAPSMARELGFGAGMGLPNIQRNTDRFSIQSTVDKGTQVRFMIRLRPLETSAVASNSVVVEPGLCRECLACLHACPTAAVRVRGGKPEILAHLCVDCTSCIGACKARSLTMRFGGGLPSPTGDTVLVLPASLLEQFGPNVRPEQVLDAVAEIGFRTVRLSEDWEQALRRDVAAYAEAPERPRPVLSPMCPVVVNLVQVRFPSLMGHVAPFRTPLEAAREEITAPHVVFVPVCPSQQTLLSHPSLLTRIDLIMPSTLLSAVSPKPAGHERSVPRERAVATETHGALQVSGMWHVMKVLDAVENGLMDDYAVLELYACDQGCFGSPVWTEDPFVARPRWLRETGLPGSTAKAVRRTEPLQARPGQRLDPDMAKAIEKLARIDAIMKSLPGRDCGVCGAPTCAALAEDIALGRADLTACTYRETGQGERI